jgi:hypothetical protein
VDIQPVEPADRGRVPKALEGRADERRPAIPVVHERQVGREGQAVVSDTLAEGVELAVDGPVIGLAIGGHPGVKGGTDTGRSHR